MKNTLIKTSILTLAILGVSSAYAAGGKHAGKNNQTSQTSSSETQTISTLTSFESSSLQYMREEEKVARDVYLTLYDTWGMPIFQNIANAEQTHTDKVEALLIKYNIEDPVKSDEIGAFTDPAFSKLYADLVKTGSESYEGALRVGMEIEELDIADIQEQINLMKQSDIINTYNNLLKGSRNHLRSFYKLIEQGGFEYIPTHISQEEFDFIVNSETETGNVNITTTTTTSTQTRNGRGGRH